MGIKEFFKRMFGKKHKSRHFHVTVTFKKELSENNNGTTWLLASEPITVNDEWCYAFRSVLNYKVLNVSFIDQYDRVSKRTYNCVMQHHNRLIFVNDTRIPEEYGKILMVVPRIENVGEKKFMVMAEVGDFERVLNGAYKDFSLIGKTVNFDIKYTHEPIHGDI